MQQLGGGLELLVLEQPAHQRFARILVRDPPAAGSGRGSSIRDLMWISVAAITRNSPATSRFELLHQLDVRRGTAAVIERDRNVVDVDLVLLDQVQQQIERPLEILEPDRVGLEGRLEFRCVLRHVRHSRQRYSASSPSRTRSIVSCGVRARLARPFEQHVAQVRRASPATLGAPLADRLEVAR